MMTATVFHMKKQSTRKIFKQGQEIEVTITGVKDFGAFGVIIVEGVEHTALIHRSNIHPNDKYPFVARYFRLGDVVRGIVRGFDDKDNMGLDVRDFFDQLTDHSEENKQAFEIVDDEVKKNDDDLSETTISNQAIFEGLSDKEVDELYEEIKPTLLTTLNTISQEGEEVFKATIKEVGIVKFCITLGTAITSFHIDPAVMLAEKVYTQIQDKSRGCL